MKRLTEVPLSEEQFKEVVAYFDQSDKRYDVTFLDRALIMQFKELPDVKQGLTVNNYTDILFQMFLTSIYNYEYDMQQLSEETPLEDTEQ